MRLFAQKDIFTSIKNSLVNIIMYWLRKLSEKMREMIIIMDLLFIARFVFGLDSKFPWNLPSKRFLKLIEFNRWQCIAASTSKHNIGQLRFLKTKYFMEK